MKSQEHMHKFWANMDVAIKEYSQKIRNGHAFLEIQSNIGNFRSVSTTHNIYWVRWHPYKVVGHFSCLEDPDAIIVYRKESPCPKPTP